MIDFGDRFWEKNIMGENISVTKIKHLEKFMRNMQESEQKRG